jgi:hypothetical protein
MTQAPRIAIINFSGNAGKTTLAAHLFAPRLPGAKVISVETLNIDGANDGVDVERMRGTKFADIQREIMMADGPVIIDVGSSNVEAFVKGLQLYAGSHSDIDLWIVPTTKERKTQGDTINTVRTLNAIGVDAKRIHVILNKLPVDEAPEDEFAAIYGFVDMDRLCSLHADSVIYSNEAFERIKGLGMTLSDIAADQTDYRAKFREATDEDAKETAIRMLQLKQLSGAAVQNLDRVFAAVCKMPRQKAA